MSLKLESSRKFCYRKPIKGVDVGEIPPLHGWSNCVIIKVDNPIPEVMKYEGE